jgi:hypothetical protein
VGIAGKRLHGDGAALATWGREDHESDEAEGMGD